MIKAILHWNASLYRDGSLQYLRKSSREGQFLLQLQSTPLNNQLCDQIKMFSQGQSSTSIFLPVLGRKKKQNKPLYTKPEISLCMARLMQYSGLCSYSLNLKDGASSLPQILESRQLSVVFIMAPIHIRKHKRQNKSFP